MPICRVEGCTSTRKNPSVTLHQFPKECRVREQWLMFCGCKDGPNLFVCSLHFQLTDYENIFMKNARRKLQKDAVPTIRQPSDDFSSVLDSASTQPNYITKRQNENNQSENQTDAAAILPQVAQRPPADPKVRCRVCTKRGIKLVPFAADEPDPSGTIRPQLPCSLQEAIAAVGGVQVDPDDGLPQYCCVVCIWQIEPAYRVRQLCQDSDRKLRDMFPTEGGGAEQELAGQMVFVKVEEILGADPVQIKEEPLDVEEAKEEPMLVAGAESNRRPVQLSDVPFLDHAERDTGMVVEPDLQENDLADESYLEHAEFTVETDSENELTDAEYVMEETEGLESETSGDDFTAQESTNFGENKDDWYNKIPVTGIRCCGCNYTFKTKAQLLAHRDKKHISRKRTPEQLLASGCQRVQCEWCYKVLARVDYLEKHQARDAFEYRCKACGTSFHRRQMVLQHFQIMHQRNVVGPITCCGCSKILANSEELATHSKAVHLPDRPPPNKREQYECSVCYASYKVYYKLYNHSLRMNNSTTTLH